MIAVGSSPQDVTRQTTFSIRFSAAKSGRRIRPDGFCTGATWTATKYGRHTVTGTLDLGDSTLSATAALQVVPRHRRMGRPQPLTRLMLFPPEASVQAGEPVLFRAEGYDAAGHNLGDYTADTVFSVTPPNSCTITGAQVTCTRAGTYKVTGTVDLGDRAVSGTASLEVVPGPLDHLALNPADATVEAGQPQDYHAFGFDRYDNERDDDLTGRVDLSIGRVDPSTAGAGSCNTSGCTATKTGDYRVTATVVDTKISGTASLHVVPGPIAKLTINPGEATIGVDARLPYQAEGADAYGNKIDGVTGQTNFRIEESPGSCTQDGCGASQPGDYTVIGQAIGTDVTGKAVLHVVSTLPATLELRPGEATIGVGASQSYLAEGFDADHKSLGDYATRTRFSIKEPNGSCAQGRCGATKPGAYTVIGTVLGTQVTGTAGLRVGSTSVGCAPPPGDVLELRVTPGKGATRTQLQITAKLNPALANCVLRIFFGGSRLGTDVTVGPDGSVSERRTVPQDTKPGTIPVGLATTGDQVLAERPFQVTAEFLAWPPSEDPLPWLFAIGLLLLLALLLGLLGQRDRRGRRWVQKHFRAEPHPSADDISSLDQDPESEPSFSWRLQAHGDAGTQTFKEGD